MPNLFVVLFACILASGLSFTPLFLWLYTTANAAKLASYAKILHSGDGRALLALSHDHSAPWYIRRRANRRRAALVAQNYY